MPFSNTNQAASRQPGVVEINFTTDIRLDCAHLDGPVRYFRFFSGIAKVCLDPLSPSMSDIKLVDKVVRDADGLIEVETDLCMLIPEQISNRPLTVVCNIVNRGGWIGPLADLRKGPEVLQEGESAIANGAGYIASMGMATVWCGWQGDISPEPGLILARLPRALGVRGWVSEEIIPDTPMGGTYNHFEPGYVIAELLYPILDLTECTLSVRQQAMDTPESLSLEHVTVLDENRVKIRLVEGFDAGAIYCLKYKSTDPVVGGLGFPVVREVYDFLKHSKNDQCGNSNPLWRENQTICLIAKGYSQTARFLREYLYLGFNQTLASKQLFDGMFIIGGGARITKANQPFWRVSRFSRQHEDSQAPDLQFPFAYTRCVDPLSGATDSLLQRSEEQGCTPKIMQLETDSETWHARLSLIATDLEGRDLVIPPSVRLYFVAGQHVVGSPEDLGVINVCQAATNPIDWGCYARALLSALVDWVTEGVEPPASRFPSVTEGTLVSVSQAQDSYPRYKGLPYDATLAPAIVTNDKGETHEYPVLVPCPDNNGNPLGGIPTPQMLAPLGTYSGRNRRIEGHGAPGLAVIWGSFEPFAQTKAARLAVGDDRLSLQERYSSPAQFTRNWVDAIDQLLQAGLLLGQDASRLIAEGERLAHGLAVNEEMANGRR